jgi:hypothetical protein
MPARPFIIVGKRDRKGEEEEEEKAVLTEVAEGAAIARLALADVGRDASAVTTILGADGDATVAAGGFGVALAALLHGLLFRQFLPGEASGLFKARTPRARNRFCRVVAREAFLWPAQRFKSVT